MPSPPTTNAPTTLRLGNFIQVFLVPISGEEVFQDQTSPQFRAAEYISEEDPYTGEILDETILAERYGIITTYFATGGENWNRCSLGDETCAGAWLTGDACGWEFVSCNGDGRIVAISFGKWLIPSASKPSFSKYASDTLLASSDEESPVGLSGALPLEVYVLELLQDLVIVNEPIGGVLPERFGAEAANMAQLSIQGTQMGGSIPDGYLSNSPLVSLLMSSNTFEGPIPLNVGSGSVEEMDLSGNKLGGELPAGLAGYESLQVLSLQGNLFSGTVPVEIGDLSNLEVLNLEGNNLTGEIAAEICDLRDERLDVLTVDCAVTCSCCTECFP